jgi:hypothetical protein
MHDRRKAVGECVDQTEPNAAGVDEQCATVGDLGDTGLTVKRTVPSDALCNAKVGGKAARRFCLLSVSNDMQRRVAAGGFSQRAKK